MTRLGRNELSLGRFVTPEEVVEKITAVTRGQVQELAQELFAPEKFTIATIGPIKKLIIGNSSLNS